MSRPSLDSVLAAMEQCLGQLDQLGAMQTAARLSHAIDTFKAERRRLSLVERAGRGGVAPRRIDVVGRRHGGREA